MLSGLAVLAFLAGPGNVVNARLETREATGRLASIVADLVRSGAEPTWIAYEAPARRAGQMCCYELRGSRVSCPGCVLEGDHRFGFSSDRTSGPGLEPSATLRVLYRVAGGRVSDVRTYSSDCPIDAGGRPVLWLSGITPAESLAFLRTLVPALDDDALAAIAQHEGPGSDALLMEFARDARSSERRSQALFWLAQVASRKAVGEIDRAIALDPETEVKKRAVFALSELPADEGVPHLIELARHHKNPAVREQAFFWLGESEDPRALALFEEVLKK
jgi:hypothetical protein